MRFGRLSSWGGRSSESSRRTKSRKGDKKTKNVRHSDSNSDNEGITTKEHQRNGWNVGRFVGQALSNPTVQYLMPGALFAFACILIAQWLTPREAGDGFWDTLKTWAMAQPGVGWPSVAMAFIDRFPGVLNWWSTDSKNRTISTIPQARFISPISAEEAFVIPEYLTTLKSSITRSDVMDRDFALPPAMERSFRRAMKEAELFKEIHDGLMTDVKLTFAGHYDRLSQLHIDIERSIIDIADRKETKTSYFCGLFTKDQPYARARNHHKSLRSITDDMFEATMSEMKLLARYREKLRVFETNAEPHGAICGLRSKTLKSIQRWTKETKDIRAEVKVMCNSSKRSKVKLGVGEEALGRHLASIDAVRQGLLNLQHDQAKTLETALLSYCKSLLEAMRRLAEFGNG
ncbi:hypothetical protein NCS57_00675400 [Fusarium keratoplasticum]|uniref:Uncharacterized protein n=1 Tax=Fusarium keratoplasticum TaxID=1328300 RepID=A0ACC0QY88_9HYPO|nr:hypothetical protein NCS57_00675400 [Fusarium keratoplasticum]KAI8668637.1 hypothetical protein NCS57_00675400 [Fusarium keratoplasticum]